MPDAGHKEMETVTLDSIEPKIKLKPLIKLLRIEGNEKYTDSFKRLFDEAVDVARPKAMYKAVYFDTGEDDNIFINGIELKSRVLSVNLKGAFRVFPFVATCGTEAAAWAESKTEMLESFWASSITQSLLGEAMIFARKQIKERYQLKKTSLMTPGSLEDWPLQEQKPLFSILGDVEGAIGVRVTESLMMTPVHSVSGILFPTEVSFESCQLCPREGCPGRRAPYDDDLYDKKYRS
jgi:hypothetical protein